MAHPSRRALLRVSRAGAAQVAAQLRARDVPARLAPVGRAWSAVPPALYGVVAAAGVTGVVAGGVAMPFFLVSTPLVVGLMLVSAHRAVREPLVATAARRSPLPDDVDRKVSASLGRIPAGPARRLLVDLARLAQRAPTAEVVELLAAACDAAEDLAGLDESLRVLERREESERGGPALGESVLLCERARDRLVQQLLDALAAMARTQSQATGPADAELGELARALADRSERDAAALREVDALLAGGGARA
jgi:hypothetical protein